MKVCFTGYRPSKLPWGYDEASPPCVALKTVLAERIASLAGEGCDWFISGCAEGVDTYCAEAVLSMSARGLRLECAVPHPDQERGWSPAAKARYHAILARADRVTTVSEVYTPYCMMKRNRYMVDASDAVLAVFDGRPGGTDKTVAYARKKGKRVIVVPLGVCDGCH